MNLDIALLVLLACGGLVWGWNPFVGFIKWVETRRHERNLGYALSLVSIFVVGSFDLDKMSIGAGALFFVGSAVLLLVSCWLINAFPYRSKEV